MYIFKKFKDSKLGMKVYMFADQGKIYRIFPFS